MDDAQDFLPLLAFERQAGGADPLRAEAALLNGQFDVLDEFDRDVEVEQGSVPAVKLARLFPLAAGGELPQILVLAREGEAHARNPTLGAQQHTLEGEVIDAGEEN